MTSACSANSCRRSRRPGAALNDKIYTLLLANTGNFFAAGNNNYITGSTTNLSISSMNSLVTKMRRQTDGEGNTLDIAPAVLLVPPELDATARQILNSELVMQNTTSDTPTGNPMRGLVGSKPKAASRIRPSRTTRSRAGICSRPPADVPFVVGFLEGRDTPTVEAFGMDADPGRLAMS